MTNSLVSHMSSHKSSDNPQGKMALFEEAIRVPLLMRLPGAIKAGKVVERAVSHIDLVATILDYTGHSRLDRSDGHSLRPTIEGRAYSVNQRNDYVVAEIGDGDIGSSPHLMIRRGRYKLMMVKKAASTTKDMLFDLVEDPFEMHNLLDTTMGSSLIGKAEHLKILLVEWMVQNDGGAAQYYSRPKSNGQGDIAEVGKRRTWPLVDQWQSDTVIVLGRPVLIRGKWRISAWLYIGRTTKGQLNVSRMFLEGAGKQHFTLSQTRATIQSGSYVRVRISFVSDTQVDPRAIKTRIVIESSVLSRRTVRVKAWA